MLYNFPMRIGRRLRELRQRKHLSAQQFAKRVGVSRQTVYDWEDGKYPPARENYGNISNALDFPEWKIADVIDEGAEELLDAYYDLPPGQRYKAVNKLKSLKSANKK